MEIGKTGNHLTKKHKIASTEKRREIFRVDRAISTRPSANQRPEFTKLYYNAGSTLKQRHRLEINRRATRGGTFEIFVQYVHYAASGHSFA